MADMYSIVKKQDEKIDGLLKIAKENKDLLTDIDTRLVSTPEQTSTAPCVPDKIQVELPENVATTESVRAVVEAALKQQKSTLSKVWTSRSSRRSWQKPSPKPSRTDSTRTSQRHSMSASEMSSQTRLTDSTNRQRSSPTECIA